MNRRHGPSSIAKLILVLVALLLSSCGGSDDTATNEATDGAADEAATDIGSEPPPADLAFLGSLASPDPEVSSATFDTAGGSLDADSATVTVPAGAFAEPTRIVATVVELDVSPIVTPPFEATIYSLSTLDDIALAEPVVLEVPKRADSVIVTQRVNGEWSPVEVPPGPTTQVSIHHFSEVTTAVIDKPAAGTVATPPSGDEFVPAVYLEACLLMFTDGDFGADDELIADIGYSVCTQSLIDTLTPFDAPKVGAACVGDKIGPAVDIRAAIAQCIDESNQDAGGTADGATESTGDEGATEAPAPDEQTVRVDPASYDVYPVEGVLDELRYSVIDGVLDVSVTDDELTMTGTLLVEKALFGYGVAPGPICTSIQAVDVTATAPIEAEMSFRLQTTGVEPFEIKAYTDQCKPESWIRNAESNEQWMIDNGPATVRVTVEDGTLIGSVNNGATGNNLERAG